MQSLDGYVCGPDGELDWGHIDEELHAFANTEGAAHGIEFYGRRMYETMVAWETLDQQPDLPDVEREFARIWKATQKVVISTTLKDVASSKTTVQRRVDPAVIRAMKLQSSKDVSVSGPTLASAFIAAGLVDEISTYVVPVVLGGGTPFFVDVPTRLDLELVEVHRFTNGTVFLRYQVRR